MPDKLEAFAEMLRTADGVEVERWVHLPLAGLMVRMGSAADELESLAR